jgi:hypothetical protein
MSKAACKVVVDWYAALAAEAAGLYVVADRAGYFDLAGEAFALWEGSKGICEAGSEMARYLEAEGGTVNQALIAKIVAMSVDACDWSKTTRKWTDRVSQKEKLDAVTIAKWIATSRSWRDDGAKLIRDIATDQMVSA